MKSGFEELFTEIQSDTIALCLEYLEKNNVNADVIYVYIYQTKYSRTFNAFFSINNKIKTAGEFASEEDSDAFFDIGLDDVEALIDLCAKYEHPCPNEFKLVYDVRTKHFSADYKYEEYSETDLDSDEVFMNWIKENEK